MDLLWFDWLSGSHIDYCFVVRQVGREVSVSRCAE